MLPKSAPLGRLQITKLLSLHHLLGGEVEVEAVLEPVELELSWGEEVPWGLGGGGSELLGLELLLELLPGGGGGGGHKGLGVPVGGVVGVDEGVHAGAVGTGGHVVLAGSDLALVTVAVVASVGVVLEVPVCGVVGVDKGVEARSLGALGGLGGGEVLGGLGGHKCVLGGGGGEVLLGLEVLVVVVVGVGGARVDGLLGGELLLLRLLGESLGLGPGGGGLGDVASSGLAVGAGGHVVALQDPEAVLAGGVPHGDGLAVVVDVAVLADPLAVSAGLLPVHGPILLGVRCSKPSKRWVKIKSRFRGSLFTDLPSPALKRCSFRIFAFSGSTYWARATQARHEART